MRANKIHKLLGILFVLGVASILLACPGEDGSDNGTTGSTSTDISTLTLSYANVTGVQNTQVDPEISPEWGGGGIPEVTYTIAPALPDGLVIDVDSGVISGTPTTIQAAQEYTVTATGVGPSYTGTKTAMLSISVVDVNTLNLNNIFARWKESDSYKAIKQTTPGTGIATVDALKNIKNDLAKTYWLASNIDVSGAAWEPLGSTGTPFTGTFIGNGYIVYGLTIAATSTDDDRGKYQGLFAAVDNATIKDVGIGVTSISGVEHVGALIGEARGTSAIDNVAVAGMADTAEIVASEKTVGGLVGRITGTTVEVSNAYNLEMVVKNTKTGVSVSSEVGGLVGSVMTNKIHGYTFTGDDDTKTIISGKGLVGGLVGNITGAADVRGYVSGQGVIEGDRDVGGLVGSVGDGSIVRGYFDGGKVNQIAGSSGYVGGLVGRFAQGTKSAIVGYVANATITGIQYVGGLAGWLVTGIVSGYVVDSTLTGTGTTIGHSVGGFVGQIYDSNNAVVSGYVVGGSISGKDRAGGLVGSVIQNNSLTGTARIGGYVETRVTTTATDPREAKALVSYNTAARIMGYWDQSAVGNSNESRGTAISAIAEVVYDSITGAYTDSGKNNAVVFDDANFLTQFALPEASAQRPTLHPYRILPYDITLSATPTSVTYTENLLAVAPWDNADTVTWSSSNTAVVTVDDNGVATGQGRGSAKITATWKSGDGTVTGTATMSITVP